MYGEFRLTKLKSAAEYWQNPPVRQEERVASKRMLPNHKTDHESYMDFAECYADYVVDYEKDNA